MTTVTRTTKHGNDDDAYETTTWRTRGDEDNGVNDDPLGEAYEAEKATPTGMSVGVATSPTASGVGNSWLTGGTLHWSADARNDPQETITESDETQPGSPAVSLAPAQGSAPPAQSSCAEPGDGCAAGASTQADDRSTMNSSRVSSRHV